MQVCVQRASPRAASAPKDKGTHLLLSLQKGFLKNGELVMFQPQPTASKLLFLLQGTFSHGQRTWAVQPAKGYFCIPVISGSGLRPLSD